MSEIHFARTEGGAEVAYRVLGGEGPGIVYSTAGTDPIEVQEEDRFYRRFLRGLCELGRVVTFDRRGVGQSDLPDWGRSLARQWAADVVAVMDEAAMETATMVTWNDLLTPLACVELAPERVDRIVVVAPSALYARDPDLRWTTAEAQRNVNRMLERAEDIGAVAFLHPERAEDPAFSAWYERAGRLGASGRVAERIFEGRGTDVRTAGELFDHDTPPSLIVHRDDPAWGCSAEVAEDIARRLSDGRSVSIPGVGGAVYASNPTALLREISIFLTGEVRVAEERVLQAILFTDIVDSTRQAAARGDATWSSVLDRHDQQVRSVVAANGGWVVKFTGDGMLSCFATGTRALDAAVELGATLSDLGLRTRAGVHVAEIEMRGDDIGGIGVHVAARIMAEAPDEHVTASASAVQSALGGPHSFVSLGSRQLKGIPGTHELFQLDR